MTSTTWPPKKRDVQVLPDRPLAPRHPPRRAEGPAKREGDGLHFLRDTDDVVERYLDEWDAHPVEGVLPRSAPLLQDPRGVLLHGDRLDAHLERAGGVDAERPPERDDRGPLKARRVRPVDDQLAHHVHLVDGARPEHLCHEHGGLDRLAVGRVGGLLVCVDEARRLGVPLVEVDPPLVELEDRGGVYLPELALGRAQPPLEGERELLGLYDRAGAEELGAGRKLLMDLQAHPELARLGVEGEARACGSLRAGYLLWTDRTVVSPARFSRMTFPVSSADFVFASAHISFARAVSGSMSSRGTTPAFRRSLPVS